jgi:hypothetical protein
MRRVWPLAALCVASAAAPAAAGPFDDLLTTVPPTANVLVLLDVKALADSPVGKKAGWGEKIDERYRSGAGVMPPGSERILIAAQADFAGGGRLWQAAVVQAPAAPTLKDLADREQAEPNEVGGLPVVLSRRGAYFAAPAAGQLVAFYPPNRQALSQWATHAREAKAADLSRYLAEAARRVEGQHVVIALDLTDVVDPDSAKEAAASFLALPRRNVDPAAFGKLLGTLRGLTFTAKAGDRVTGTLRIDFGSNPLPFERVLKDVFLEVLAGEGADLPELARWDARYTTSTMFLSGSLSPESFERLVGVFSFPQAGGAAAGEKKPTLARTRWYFGAVQAVVEDVRKATKATNADKTALWHETAARRIGQIDPRGVDPAVVKAAREVAARLQAVAASLQGVPIDLEKLKQHTYFYTAGYTWGGWWRMPSTNWVVTTNLPEMRARMEKVIADDAKNRELLWKEIDDLIAQTQSKLPSPGDGR